MTLSNFARLAPRALDQHPWLIEDSGRGVFSVRAKAYSDPHLYVQERRRIFDQCWLYAAHDSEIPNTGDFVTRRVGGREVLIVRGKDGRVRIFLNVCRHKGGTVCREHSGNAALFRCAYHAWTYNNQGALTGIPQKEGYGADFNKQGSGLLEIRMEAYRDLLFLCYDANSVSLRDYLGAAADMLDLIFEQHEQSKLQTLPGAYQYTMAANWKLLMENSMDAYHVMSAHSRFFTDYLPAVFDVRMTRDDLFGPTSEYAGVRDLGNGHSVNENLQFIRSLDTGKRAAWEARVGAARARRLLDYNRNVLIYPNTLIAEQFLMIRTCFPVSENVTETTAFALVPSDEDPALRERRALAFSSFQGPGGFGTPDDIEILEQCQRNCRDVPDDAYFDASRGMQRAVPNPDDELQNRLFLQEWHRRLFTAGTP